MEIKYKKYKIPVLLLIVLLSAGCKKNFLDTRIDTEMTPEDLATNRGTIWAFASAFYIPINYGFQVLDNNMLAAISDEAQQTAASGNVYYFNRGVVNADINPLAFLYNDYYEGIRAANFFLDYAKNGEALMALNRDTVRDANGYQRDLATLRWYRAEAQIAKAYYYSELIKMYGGVPVVDSTLDKDPDPGRIPRSSYDEVVQYIVNLIDTYINELQEDWKTSDGFANQDGRFDRATALAIKARVLLYAASPLNNPGNDVVKWQKAASAAQALIDAKGYTIPENRNYGDLFAGNNPVQSPEVIFAIRRPDNNEVEMNNYPISTPGGRSGITPTHNLVSAYEYTGTPDPDNPYANRDPRLQSSVVVNGSWWNGREINEAAGGADDMNKSNTSRTGYYLKKFLTDDVNLIQGAATQHQWIIFRYTEALLNYAEAMNEAYGPDDLPDGYTITARQALMQVRRGASTDLPEITTADKDEFRNTVKHERRVELAFEDHRYWDLLRWKDAKAVLNQPIVGLKITKDGSGKYHYTTANVAERVFMDRNYRFPFSRNEIMNSNGTMSQNEGY
ncbi:MAG: RagB/SusD family nutrient uptake outer membrane protein [Agriterribacter sp.]